MLVSYYIKHPNGRTKIDAIDDAEARYLFENHWTAKVSWSSKNPKRVLVKEVRTEILTETL